MCQHWSFTVKPTRFFRSQRRESARTRLSKEVVWWRSEAGPTATWTHAEQVNRELVEFLAERRQAIAA